MIYRTLVSTDILGQQINNPDWVIIDSRFSLADSESGIKSYRMGHIPNARYAHLNKDLSSAITDTSGRHPLPDFNLLAKKLGLWGITNKSQVIVYDDANGAFAARLWWLLRCLGHDSVAILDGGINHWQQQGMPLTTILPSIKPKEFRAYITDSCWLTATQVTSGLATRQILVVDARTAERFRGEQEPVDPVAGHIPKAINRSFQLNLEENGLFLDRNELQQQFTDLLGSYNPEQTVHMCGSGVTACHNLLAMEYAGLPGSKLYPGSWSEWITNRNRPIATN
jgi:thiosulfate/3-mercaptopyruvate sulfurtransferase